MPIAIAEDSSRQTIAPTHMWFALVVALALVVLSDWLFWGHAIGISMAIWIVAIVLGTAFVNHAALNLCRAVAAGLVALLAVLPVIEAITPLSLIFGMLGLAATALIIAGARFEAWPRLALAPLKLIVSGPFRLFPDMVRLHAQGNTAPAATALGVWVVPVLLGLVFIILFSAANPLFERWLLSVRLDRLWQAVSLPRTLFWFALLCVVWGFIKARVTTRKTATGKSSDETRSFGQESLEDPFAAVLFGPDAILRSLIVFNGLFAVQTGLDIAYLWHGAGLPDGMSYARYAHRGAYPLMVTAALAAVFVIATFGPGRDDKNSSIARALVCVWILQNVVLVASSVRRLNLYVEVYSLTYWRVAAFIWMGLVAIGLVLILLRITRRYSNTWLVGANLAAATAVLYACTFVNFASLIANYNVDHSARFAGPNFRPLDISYLIKLGRQATPAMLRYAEFRMREPMTGWPNSQHRLVKIPLPEKMLIRICRSKKDVEGWIQKWRSWTFRDARLVKKLTVLDEVCHSRGRK